MTEEKRQRMVKNCKKDFCKRSTKRNCFCQICPNCGASLDYGEKCDCKNKENNK